MCHLWQISDLIGHQRTSINPDVAATINEEALGRALRPLQQYVFWDIVSKSALYEHQ
jgi:hypothetical protein